MVDGEEVDVIPVLDSAVLRGDGCFEACRSYRGRIFALKRHLDRLARSAKQMDLPIPDRSTLKRWCESVVNGSDEIVRIVITRGDAVGRAVPSSRVLILTHPLPPRRDSVTLLPRGAPWHPAGRWSELAGAKTTSYAPNAAASRAASAAGFDDALLIADDGTVLEGPTFSVGWIVDQRVETPSLDLFILDSISRRVMTEIAPACGFEIVEVRSRLEGVRAASGVFAMSTVKEITPVTAIGEEIFPISNATERLAAAFRGRVAQETGTQTSEV